MHRFPSVFFIFYQTKLQHTSGFLRHSHFRIFNGGLADDDRAPPREEEVHGVQRKMVRREITIMPK